MNQPIDQWQKELERATAPLGPERELDAESAGLRETWLAWGQLLEASDVGDEPTIAWNVPLAPATRRQWLPLAAGLLAALLLVAVSLLTARALNWTWRTANRQPGDVASSQPVATAAGKGAPEIVPNTAIAVPTGVAPTVKNPAVGKKTVLVAAATAADQPQLDDAIDQQIADVGQQFVAVRQEWSSPPDAFQAAHYAAQLVQHEVDTGGL